MEASENLFKDAKEILELKKSIRNQVLKQIKRLKN